MITDTLAVTIWLLVLFVAAPLFGAFGRWPADPASSSGA
jgi:hypothetical protein